MSAFEADRLFRAGEISNKHAFRCPSCEARVVCANLDRAFHLRKVRPYFRLIGEHNQDCKLAADFKTSFRSRTFNVSSGSEGEKQLYKPLPRLNLSAPDNKISKTKEFNVTNEEPQPYGSLTIEATSSDGKRQKRISLAELVDLFLDNPDGAFEVGKGTVMPFQEFFIPIQGQDTRNHKHQMRCYYGKAWFNPYKTGYSVNFAEQLIYKGQGARPSFFIPNKLIQNHKLKKFQNGELKKIADNKPRTVFLISKKGPYLKEPYINFDCEALEYVDYR